MNPEKKENRCQVSGLPPFIASREFPCCSVGRETHTKPGTLRWVDGTERLDRQRQLEFTRTDSVPNRKLHIEIGRSAEGPPQVFRGISTSV